MSVRRRRWLRPYAVCRPAAWPVARPGDLVELDTLDIRLLPDRTSKQFAARDIVNRPDGLALGRRTTARAAADVLDRLAERMPFPVRAISIDNGSEFMAEFETACEARGIALFVLPPRSPKLHGAVERANRTHAEEFYEVTTAEPDLASFQAELRTWETVINSVRPHQSLGYLRQRSLASARSGGGRGGCLRGARSDPWPGAARGDPGDSDRFEVPPRLGPRRLARGLLGDRRDVAVGVDGERPCAEPRDLEGSGSVSRSRKRSYGSERIWRRMRVDAMFQCTGGPAERPRDEAAEGPREPCDREVILVKLSARNQFPATVRSVTDGAVMSEVTVEIEGGHELVAAITAESARRLGLAPGKRVVAVIKATEVILATDD